MTFRQLILQFRSKDKFERSDNYLHEDENLNQLLPVNCIKYQLKTLEPFTKMAFQEKGERLESFYRKVTKEREVFARHVQTSI